MYMTFVWKTTHHEEYVQSLKSLELKLTLPEFNPVG